MSSLFEDPGFLELQHERYRFDLRSGDLHSPLRLEATRWLAPYWKISLTHQDISLEGFDALHELACSRGALEKMTAMQGGALVNQLPGQPGHAALHTAQRAPVLEVLEGKAHDVAQLAQEQRHAIGTFLKKHQELTTLVVLGIGGSYLGPEALYEALYPTLATHHKVIFLPNVDPTAHERAARGLDPATTLIAIVSKSGKTLETMHSYAWWKTWLESHGRSIRDHVVAVTTPGSALDDAGWAATFLFDDSIGGRYSATSVVGALPLAFAYGIEVVEALLEGAWMMDQHALETTRNVPLILAELAIWHGQVQRRRARVVVPYQQRLHRFFAHLQQLEMESLGKSSSRNNEPLGACSGALVMGDTGTAAQHSFFQWLHQGTDIVPVDFIVETATLDWGGALEQFMADELLANALAQSHALAAGYQDSLLAKSCPGGRPSTLIACEALIPQSLGALLALYEHKTAFEGFILGLNPFDQEGVELGKRLALEIHPLITRSRSESYWWSGLL